MSENKVGMKKERCDTLVQEWEVMSWERNPQPDDEGVKNARAAVEKDPENAELWMELGLAYANLGYYREATECYSHAISINPFDWRFYRHRAHRFISCNLFQDGAADFTIATRLNPKDWNCWYHLGLAYFLLEDYEHALEAYKTCYSLNKTLDDLCACTDWYWMTLKRLGRDEEAQALIDKVEPWMGKDLGEMDGLGYFNRIMVYKGINPPESLRPQAGDDNKALRIVTQGFGLANYYHIIGEEEKSVAMLKEVIETAAASRWYSAFGCLAAHVDVKRRGIQI